MYHEQIEAIQAYLSTIAPTVAEIQSLEAKNVSAYEALASSLIDNSDGKFTADQVPALASFFADSFSSNIIAEGEDGYEAYQAYQDYAASIGDSLDSKWSAYVDGLTGLTDEQKTKFDKYTDDQKMQALFADEVRKNGTITSSIGDEGVQ